MNSKNGPNLNICQKLVNHGFDLKRLSEDVQWGLVTAYKEGYELNIQEEMKKMGFDLETKDLKAFWKLMKKLWD